MNSVARGLLLYLATIVTVAAIMASAFNWDYIDEMQSETFYCEMVHLYKATGGKEGWPDYKHSYQLECSTQAPKRLSDKAIHQEVKNE